MAKARAYTIIKPDMCETLEVTGTYISIAGFNCFIHRIDPSTNLCATKWAISEFQTGARVAEGTTKRNTEIIAWEKLSRWPRVVKKTVARLKKAGVNVPLNTL